MVTIEPSANGTAAVDGLLSPYATEGVTCSPHYISQLQVLRGKERIYENAFDTKKEFYHFECQRTVLRRGSTHLTTHPTRYTRAV